MTYDVPMRDGGAQPAAENRARRPCAVEPGYHRSCHLRLRTATAASDQINCVLRDVGTFPAQPAAATNFVGDRLPATDAPTVLEVRQDMKTLALGATGFNIPSLVGLATGAPYFHAGNARTLEEAFDDVFEKHHQALAPTSSAIQRQRESRSTSSSLICCRSTTAHRGPEYP